MNLITLKDANGLYHSFESLSLYEQLSKNGTMLFGLDFSAILEVTKQFKLKGWGVVSAEDVRDFFYENMKEMD